MICIITKGFFLKKCDHFYRLILYLRAISSPENFLSFIGMDQDPASYFQNGLEMTVLFLNFVIVF